MYFKPEGETQPFYPARINTNLIEFSDVPLKDKKFVPISDKDRQIAKSLARESSAPQSHLLWLTDLLVALNNRMEAPNSRATIQPIVAEVLQHQK